MEETTDLLHVYHAQCYYYSHVILLTFPDPTFINKLVRLVPQEKASFMLTAFKVHSHMIQS